VTEARRRSVAAGEGSGGELLSFDMVWNEMAEVWCEKKSNWSAAKEGECSKFRSRGYLLASRVMCLE